MLTILSGNSSPLQSTDYRKLMIAEPRPMPQLDNNILRMYERHSEKLRGNKVFLRVQEATEVLLYERVVKGVDTSRVGTTVYYSLLLYVVTSGHI